MYLKSLSVSGFKSFAKKGELTFDAPITAIVGPNGSGKSNVAESFRFVLGEQSVKSMRGKKGEDLIWGGSSQVARGNRASVMVILNNERRVFPLDFDEIRVERTVHRDGQNEYRINDSTVRLRDVQELLSAANIGPSGHHIISQGEADRILSASAKERREMIEDALGLKTYQYKKQEAEKKLGKTKENMEQVESLRREHAPHLKYLEKQIQRIEKSLAVQAELKAVYAEYLKREDTYIAFHYDRLTNSRLEPVSRLAAVQEEIAAAKQKLSDVPPPTENDTEREHERVYTTARSEREACLRSMSQLEGQIAFLEKRVASAANAETAESFVPRSELEKVIAMIAQDVEKAHTKDDVNYLQRALQDVVHALKAFIKRHQNTSTPQQDADSDELKALEKEQVALQRTHESLSQKEEAARVALEQVRAQARTEATEQHELERAVFELMNEARELDARIKDIDRELVVLDRDRIEFKRELQEAVTLIGSATARYFEYVVTENGVEVTTDAIAGESREVQRERRRVLEKLKIRLEELGIGATDVVMKEYQSAKERDEFLARELADLQTSIEKLEALIGELTAQLNEQFGKGIEQISVEFNRFFTLMFGGGSASLERSKPKVSDDEDGEVIVPEEGIELAVQLPNKRVRGLDMLSGGERALSSIALIFAMSQVNPPLFIILDETDAALDEANSRRYGDMIEALSEKSQLILITHNRETMSRASILYGVTMGSDGVSKLLSVKFDEAVAVAK